MKWHVLLPLLIVPLCAPAALMSPQIADPAKATQAATCRQTQLPHWSAADKTKLMAKAERNEPGAQFWLGVAYEEGLFGKQDFPRALKWLRRSAVQGNPDAQNSLGQMYEDGEGVPRNYVMAADWYRKAAEHVPDLGGAGQGRNNLGNLYMDGLGVPQDYVAAYMWFSLGESEHNLADAKARMTPAQIQAAEQKAADWKKRHPER
jgi:TPR repeat protein